MFSFLKNIDKNKTLIGIAVIGIIITGVLIYTNSNKVSFLFGIFGPSSEEIAKKAVEYINTSGLAGSDVTLVSAAEESGVIKMKIKVGSNEYDTYVTKDGKLLFPQVIEVAPKNTEAENQNTGATTEQTAENIKKSDSPMLEAYVVARCPYGLQMQRAMADAVENIPALANYIKSRYIGSVSSDGKTIESMHGAEEATENLRQICIRQEQPAKYWSYVACQMKAAGTETSCEKPSGVDSAKLAACMSDPSRGVAFAKEDFGLAEKYGVQGSPTLISQEAGVSESSFGGRSADAVRAIVCAASNTEPSFCSTTLNTDEAAASFSETYSSSGSSNSASCE